MFENIKEVFRMFFKSRLAVAAVLMTVLFGVLLWRVFYLQIIKGEEYQDNYTLKIVKERTLNSTRGNIYDRNGELLAYNELAYSITIEDNGSYSSTDKKNESLNAEIAQVITALEKNGDAITDDFKIDRTGEGTYEFNVTGTSLKRFLADVYGESSYDNALPWTKIAPARYAQVNDFKPLLPLLEARHAARAKADQEFIWWSEDVAEYRQRRKEKTILNLRRRITVNITH